MEMDASEVKSRLLSQLEATLAHLYPHGQVKGHQFFVGSVAGNKGRTLQVELRGAKAGLWLDRANEADRGDIFDLWQAARGCSFLQALDEARRYLGVSEVKAICDERPHGYNLRDFAPLSGTRVLSYLTDDRGISPETLQAYLVRKHASSDAYGFRYDTPEGHRAFSKFVALQRDDKGKKKIWGSEHPYATLWGWWLATDRDRVCIICEGEPDAMTVSQMVPKTLTLSVPNGTGSDKWIEHDWVALSRFETIYYIPHNDDAGRQYAEKVARRLGISRVRIVPVPEAYNDANEAWTSGDEHACDWEEWLSRSYYIVPPSVRGAEHYGKDAQRVRLKRIAEDERNDFIFPELPFALRDGELTIVTGAPGHGKSELLYQMHLHEMRIGRRVLVCSLEIPPGEMLFNMCWQLVGHFPSDIEISQCKEWLTGKLYFHSGESARGPDYELTHDELFQDALYAYRRCGVTRLVIDSLHFLVDKEDYQAQDVFTRRLSRFCKDNQVHVALVAHANLKGRSEDKIPGESDVEGSGGMIKPIHNGFTVWRNMGKQEKMDEEPHNTDHRALHDGCIKVWKQRQTGDLFTRKLWFDKYSRTFRTRATEPSGGMMPELAEKVIPMRKDLF